MLSDVSESELELTTQQPPTEKRKRTFVKKNNLKRKLRVIESSSESATDEFTPEPEAKTVADDEEMDDSLTENYLKSNKDSLDDECGGQRTTQEDKEIIEEIMDEDFNNAMLVASTPVKFDRRKQINALVIT